MSHLQYQQEPQQQPPERSGHSHQGIMDLRNLCQRLDVENLKAKLTSLPQLKLPKSLPKLRAARRIFRGSRGNGSGKEAPAATAAELQSEVSGMGMAQAQFINRTPQRISTISSLMHEHEHDQVAPQNLQPSAGGTYRSAGSLDDDYYAPYGAAARVSRPISPVKVPPTMAPGDASMPTPTPTLRNSGSSSLTQRLQRGYKSLSELRLKHLFAKQTVVRRDGIEVDRYVEQYEAERRVEQMAQARRDRQIADNYDIHISTLPITRENTLKAQQQQQQQHRRSVAEHSGDESGMEEAIPQQQQVPPVPRKKTGIAATRFARVRQPPLPMPLEDQSEEQQPQKPREPQAVRQAVRQNLKRLRKSIKRVQQPAARPAADDSDSDEEQQQQQQRKSKTRSSTGDTLRARLRRFASSEQLQQRWRRSFKSNSDSQEQAAQQPSGAASGAAFGFVGMGAHLERTMTKLNEKMQQLKFFQRSGADRAEAGNKPNTVGREPVEIDDEELEATYHHSDSSDSEDSGQNVCADEAYGQMEVEPQPDASPTVLAKRQTLTSLQASASTAWSSESLEDDATVEQQLAAAASDYPRVLIHQQHTDAYESTLILAVAATPPPVPSPVALEKHQWVSNQQIIADFKAQQMSSPSAWPAPALYKPKSIDIFEGDGGAAAAFADFDEALRNAPMLRISAGSSCDSGEDADDSSSRVTRIRLQTPQIGNSCESLMEQQPLEDDDEVPNKIEAMDLDADADANVNVDANANANVDQDVDLARLAERPPSESPPPPPLPQRRPPPPSTVAPIYDAVPPPLPISKPPPPPMQAAPLAPAPLPVAAPLTLGTLPQRSASTTRPSKPLVKTSSLRLTYNEQMHPADVGKVNKLISRFGGRPRLCARRMHSEELTTCSDADDEPQPEAEPEPQLKTQLQQPKADKQQQQQQQTPTNAKPSAIPNIVTTQPNNNNNNSNSAKTETELQLSLDRQNSNCSRSEYGSPLAYPLSNSRRRSSTPTVAHTLNANSSALALAPQSQRAQAQAQARRSRRSMTRDDDNFYSFDSDEENSYYSISPSSSSRYVVEI
ncbi:PREDICTED: actin cytoskeleton-regulatory complex protein pan1 [Drosophila arizonae]|uniref:Actin cytoskeleton-regulatory complex protein pan1 n=1 Tax=Drosophila arizonae TaxID=7263 RepID=A0ABM1PUJ2_DROAR|nr:PREDICTED: actin cytoskeleton-regulatory complex protein pan1 [Drosophila arizonae]